MNLGTAVSHCLEVLGAGFRPSNRPIELEPITAEYIHGDTGIDGLEVFEPETPLQPEHAVDFIIEALAAAIADCQMSCVKMAGKDS